ncbi:hypothetical protein GCM10022198_24100 [Klugiella xanthotipulae]|uniref:Uncharacterized protein n=1 Tax=Klugiella xanthotipulae TaxID=244735 RepID=A0A543I6G6_9MICO|nr:hypothetical protein [Klugiella xanthotipulae]TQM66141.1 hypothetical protein FB466_0971 [Klugiella xanthotipulae]
MPGLAPGDPPGGGQILSKRIIVVCRGSGTGARLVDGVFAAPALSHCTQEATLLLVCADIQEVFRASLDGGAAIVRSVVHDAFGRHAVVQFSRAEVVELWEPSQNDGMIA